MDTDGVDYQRLFANQDPMNLRVLTALRMNATFPYVLPNVWLPTTPVIDVMDAGLRDNYGQETAIRFIACVQRMDQRKYKWCRVVTDSRSQNRWLGQSL